MNPLKAIKDYGSYDRKRRKGMYYTLDLTPNSAGLFLDVGDESIFVKSKDGTLIIEWKLDAVAERFNKKVKKNLLVKAKMEERDGIEYFLYHRARLLSGGVSKNILKSQFECGKLKVDLRLHEKGTSARNHGTGFRILETDLDDFYENSKELKL